MHKKASCHDRAAPVLLSVPGVIALCYFFARVEMHVRSRLVPNMSHRHCPDVNIPASIGLQSCGQYDMFVAMFAFLPCCSAPLLLRAPTWTHDLRASPSQQLPLHASLISSDAAASCLRSCYFFFYAGRPSRLDSLATWPLSLHALPSLQRPHPTVSVSSHPTAARLTSSSNLFSFQLRCSRFH